MTMIILSVALLVCSALAQFPNFVNSYSGSFNNFDSLLGNQASGAAPPASSGTGRAMNGPIQFPPSPESRDTSGVIVGASGYGFVPPGVQQIQQGRGIRPTSYAFGPNFGNDFYQF